MKYCTGFLTIVAIVAMSLPALADEGDQRRRRGPRAQQSAKDGGAKAGNAQRRGAGGGERDPQEMVSRMMKTFDKDGDQKLNAAELGSLLASMRERRGGQGGGQREQGQAQRGKGQGGQGAGKAGRGRRSGDDGATAGGQKPRRPSAN